MGNPFALKPVGWNGAPVRTERITSSKIFYPTTDNAWCLVRIQGGGGAGAAGATYRGGGGGGAMVEVWLRVPITGILATVGAGGVGVVGDYNLTTACGGFSRFGSITAEGGKSGGHTNGGTWPYGCGGMTSQLAGSVNATGVNTFGGSIMGGWAGGAGGIQSVNGSAPGFPGGLDTTANIIPRGNGTGVSLSQIGGGGDSFYGYGGNAVSGGTGLPGTGYGGGGGASDSAAHAGGNGSQGLIEVMEYVAAV